jgi:small-conductance mechanosensitive channel
MESTVQQYLEVLGDPPVRALVLLLVFYVMAKIVELIFTRFFGRIVKMSRTEYDDRLIDILQRPIASTIILIGATWSVSILKLSETTNFVFFGAIKTLVVIIWGVAAFRMVRVFLEWLSANEQRLRLVQKHTLPLFDIIGKIVVIGGASYFLLLSWNVNVSAWLASAGILGLAVGFAAQDTLANLFAGLFIMVDAPYKVGDFIVLDSGERGRVTEIGVRSTRLLTRDDIEVTLPNAVMGKAKIMNESGGPSVKHRVRARVGVSYSSDIDLVREVLLGVARGNDTVCREPEPRVRFREFGDSSLNFELLCWIDNPEERGMVMDNLNTAIFKEFRKAGVEIPFPQRDLHIRDWPAKGGHDVS